MKNSMVFASVIVLTVSGVILQGCSDELSDAEVARLFSPAPQDAVDEVLRFAKLTDTDVVYVFRGDDRIPITAAKQYRTRCMCVYVDANEPSLADLRERVKGEGLESLVTFRAIDAFVADDPPATVVVVDGMQSLLLGLLQATGKVKNGTRIIAFRAGIAGMDGLEETGTALYMDSSGRLRHMFSYTVVGDLRIRRSGT